MHDNRISLDNTGKEHLAQVVASSEALQGTRLRLSDEKKSEVKNAIAEAIKDTTFTCSRVWEAWQYGTMGEDDFEPAWEDEELLDSIVDSMLEVLDPSRKKLKEANE